MKSAAKVLLTVLIMILFLSAPVFGLEHTNFRVVKLVGSVQTSLDGEIWEELEKPEALTRGVWLKTSNTGSAILILPDDTQTRIGASTKIRLQDPDSGDTKRLAITLSRGKLWSRTNRKRVELGIRVPRATASIRGTEWVFDVSEDGSSHVSVIEGSIGLQSASGSVQSVGAGERGQIDVTGIISVAKLVNPENAIQFIYPYLPAPIKYLPEKSVPPWVEGLIEDSSRGDWASIIRFISDPDKNMEWQSWQKTSKKTRWNGQSFDNWSAWLELLHAEVLITLGSNNLAEALIENNELSAKKWVDARRLITLGQLRVADQILASLPSNAVAAGAVDFERGIIGLAEGRLSDAHEFFSTALKQNPDDSASALHLAEVALLLGKMEQARAYLKTAEKLVSRRSGYLPYLARNQTIRNELTSASNTLTELMLIKDKIDDPRVPMSAALIALKRGNDRLARGEILKATAIAPTLSRAQMYQGIIHLQNREPSLAERRLGNASSLDPNDPLPELLVAQLHSAEFNYALSMRAAQKAETLMNGDHSLRFLANDQIGGATIGRRYYEVGLPLSARFVAESQFDPRWAGSQLFSGFSSRTDFERTGRYLLGFMLDSQTLGTRRDYPEGIARAGHHGFLRSEYSSSDSVIGRYLNFGANGRTHTKIGEVAYLVEAGTFDQRYTGLPNLSSDLRYRDDVALFGFGWRPTYEHNLVVLGTTTPFLAAHNHLDYDKDEYRIDVGYSYLTDEVVRLLHLAWQESDSADIRRATVSSNPYFEPVEDFEEQCRDRITDSFNGIELGFGEIGRKIPFGLLQWSFELSSLDSGRRIGWTHRDKSHCYIDSDFWDPVLRDDLLETIEVEDFLATVGISNRPTAGLTWDLALRYSQTEIEFHDRLEIEYGGWFPGLSIFEDNNSLAGREKDGNLQFGVGFRIPLINEIGLVQLAYIQERRPFNDASLSTINYGGISPRFDWLHPDGELDQLSFELKWAMRSDLSFFFQHETFEIQNNRLFVDYFLSQESARQIRRLALNRYQSPLHYSLVIPDRRLNQGDFDYSSFIVEKSMSNGFSATGGFEFWNVEHLTFEESSDEIPDRIFHVGSSVPLGRGLLVMRYVYNDYDQRDDAHTGYIQLRQRLGNRLDVTVGGEISRGGDGFYYLGFETYF